MTVTKLALSEKLDIKNGFYGAGEAEGMILRVYGPVGSDPVAITIGARISLPHAECGPLRVRQDCPPDCMEPTTQPNQFFGAIGAAQVFPGDANFKREMGWAFWDLTLVEGGGVEKAPKSVLTTQYLASNRNAVFNAADWLGAQLLTDSVTMTPDPGVGRVHVFRRMSALDPAAGLLVRTMRMGNYQTGQTIAGGGTPAVSFGQVIVGTTNAANFGGGAGSSQAGVLVTSNVTEVNGYLDAVGRISAAWRGSRWGETSCRCAG